MLTENDIVSIELENEWLREALDYALISWTSTFNRMGKPNPYSRVEKIVLGIIAEKAIEKYLIDNKISYETHGKTKWYEVDRYDLGIKGYAIDVKSNFLDVKSQYITNKLNSITTSKEKWFLKCHALVPMDQFNPGNNQRRAHKRDKIYLFPFLEGYFDENQYASPLIHTFWDYKWLKKGEHKKLQTLGKLTIKYDGTLKNCIIRIYGTKKKNVACVEDVCLNKNEIVTKNEFFQVFSIECINEAPDGIIQVVSKKIKLNEVINPRASFLIDNEITYSIISKKKKKENNYKVVNNDWQSLNIYDLKIHLLGWIYEEDFRITGNEFKRFTKSIEQYSEIKVDNWGCLVKELEPIINLKNI